MKKKYYDSLTGNFCLKNPKLIKQLRNRTEDGNKVIRILTRENLDLSNIQTNKIEHIIEIFMLQT